MSEFYKGYWMVTNRCNLRCSYCVLENSPTQIKAELDLNGKKELLSHLYNKLGFRRLTISGGEAVIFGKHPPSEFIEFMNYIRTFKSNDPLKNLEIELYSNGTFIDEKVAQAMNGVVDMVAVTIDSANDNFLSELGRNTNRHKNYYENITRVCGLLAANSIQVKLHSVVSQKNYASLPEEVGIIFDSIEKNIGQLSCWKFFQYMSYDDPLRDQAHHIAPKIYNDFTDKVKKILSGKDVRLHFKDNKEMNDSLFNILSYGNAQYMRKNDTWLSSQRTQDLRSYESMSDLFSEHDIDEELFRKFHQIKR